ncbi:hypothetical protein Patl1_34318 [Pistacia atlantica]|uniref:Uncharacterized protein n=1 Tax=Pistacia atlantica TaxID=434234 RepID=A0ACC0ZRG8_9ROSI|nr:hypothetical protein Patl1_34318 [Pistacia atlantica]
MGNVFSFSISGDEILSRCLDCTVAKTAYIRDLEDNLWNCKSSYKFGKRVAEKLQAVATLRSEEDFKDVAQTVLKDLVNEIPIDPKLVGMQSIFDEVWRCLGEKQVGIIGLYGTGRVGKTTLLTQINNNFCNERNDFDVVISVVVSKDHHVEKIQEEIGKKIDVGIPHPDPNNGSKIVSTTRSVEVNGHMEAHKSFRVEFLENEEAWNLFQSKVGEETLNNHPDILELAKIVAKECGGLPLALVTSGMDKVYPRLKFTYDSLPNDKVRSCFLYCSLLPEDFNVPKEDLINCWIGEGFLDEYEGIGARNQGYHFIDILLNACLLEEVSSVYDGVKIHDVIRDMALWIACEVEKKKENFLVHAGARLTEAPKADQMDRATMKHLDTLHISNCKDLVEVKIDCICKVQEIREPHGFQNLRSFAVYDCSNVEEIIDISKFGEVQEIMGNLNPFAKVNRFTLRGLPKLKSSHRNALSFPLLQQMDISECPLLMKLPLDSSRAITNKPEFVIRGEKHWWEELEWEDEATQNVFLPFFRSY